MADDTKKIDESIEIQKASLTKIDRVADATELEKQALDEASNEIKDATDKIDKSVKSLDKSVKGMKPSAADSLSKEDRKKTL